MSEWINPDQRSSKAEDIADFLDAIENVCRKHGMLITCDSNDVHSSCSNGDWIEIVDFDERELYQLRNARDGLSPFYHSPRRPLPASYDGPTVRVLVTPHGDVTLDENATAEEQIASVAASLGISVERAREYMTLPDESGRVLVRAAR